MVKLNLDLTVFRNLVFWVIIARTLKLELLTDKEICYGQNITVTVYYCKLYLLVAALMLA